jgi:hypothetical protein
VAKIEIDIDDATGEIGKLPEPVQKFLDAKYGEAFGKGAEKGEKEARQKLEVEIAKAREDERKKLGAGGDPAASEKLKNLEIELSKMKEQDAIREKNFEEAQRLREERHAKELADRDKKHADESATAKAEIDKRDARLRAAVTTDIKAEAVKAGALSSAVDDVSEILAKFVGLDADFLPVVQADEFRKRFPESKLGADDKPVTVEGLVQEYLSLKPHNKAPVKGVGGGARGGASTTGAATKGKDAEMEAALQAVADNPSVSSAAAVIGRIRQRVAS